MFTLYMHHIPVSLVYGGRGGQTDGALPGAGQGVEHVEDVAK